MKDTCFRELTDWPVKSLSDRTICRLLEKLQPDSDIAPSGEKQIALVKALKAELMRRIFLAVEQQKREYQDYKMAIAG
ncbi:MAG: hypothetical protein V4671_22800 [Armatimonadota bacterium]